MDENIFFVLNPYMSILFSQFLIKKEKIWFIFRYLAKDIFKMK